MGKEDIFKQKDKNRIMYKSLEDNTFSKHKSDNLLIKKFLDAKFQGHYKHIIYDVNSPEKTIYKNMVVLKKITRLLDKPLKDLNEEDINELQNINIYFYK